jgi:hypothetical protein
MRKRANGKKQGYFLPFAPVFTGLWRTSAYGEKAMDDELKAFKTEIDLRDYTYSAWIQKRRQEKHAAQDVYAVWSRQN